LFFIDDKIACGKKEIKSRLNSGMPASILFRMFCLPACCLKT
jgi:hypothetical protein